MDVLNRLESEFPHPKEGKLIYLAFIILIKLYIYIYDLYY